MTTKAQRKELGVGAVLGATCDACRITAGCVILCQLHAAAPEMLEFLRDAVTQWELRFQVQSGGSTQYKVPTSELQAWYASTRALLARIEGETR